MDLIQMHELNFAFALKQAVLKVAKLSMDFYAFVTK